MWFTEYATSKVARITPGGTITEYTTLFGDDNPLYITPSAGEGTSMWYSGDKGHHIGYVNASGLAGETTAPKEQDPTGIATGSDGATWFSTFEAESEASTLDRLPSLFGTITETEQFGLNLGQLLADSNLGFWYVSDTGDGASLYRITSSGIFTDEARAPTPVHGSDCYSKTNLRACPLDGLAFGPNRAVWFTDFSTNSIGVFPTGYAPLPEVSGPTGPEGKAGASGAAGAEGKAGPSGAPGAEGKEGKAGPGVSASTTIVIVPFQTTVAASSVTVHYALTAAAKITLSVTAPASAKTTAKGASHGSARQAGGTGKRPVVVASSNGKVGSNTITWNRKLSGKRAKAGTYTLILQASVGTAQAKAAEKVRLASH